MDSKGIGTIKFTNGALLFDVLYAPVGANLISVPAVTKRGESFNFAGDDVLLNETKFGNKVASRLYQSILFLVETPLVPTNWYERFGHTVETAIKAAAFVYRFKLEEVTSC